MSGAVSIRLEEVLQAIPGPEDGDFGFRVALTMALMEEHELKHMLGRWVSEIEPELILQKPMPNYDEPWVLRSDMKGLAMKGDPTHKIVIHARPIEFALVDRGKPLILGNWR